MRKIFRWVLDILIVAIFLMIPIILLNGGFKVSLFGLTVLQAIHIYNPLKWLILLAIVRLLISVKFKEFLLILGSIFISLLISELAVRIWNPAIAKSQMIQIHRASPALGWELEANASGFGQFGERYVINSVGFRDTEHPIDKSTNTYRIMTIGDSFTFGMGVDFEDSYPNQLERILNQGDAHYEVINCGVIGHNMWQHFEMLKGRALPYKPDLVILGLFEDDIGSSIAPFESDSAYRGDNPFVEERRNGLMERSALWNLLKHTNDRFEHKYRYHRGYGYLESIDKRKKMWGPEAPDNMNYKIMSGKMEKQKYDNFARTLREFVTTANDAGARVLVAMIPDSVQLNDPHMQAVNRFVGKTTTQLGVAFLDVTPVLEAQSDLLSLYLFPFDAHNSPKGLEKIAQAIASQVSALRRRAEPTRETLPSTAQ